MIELGKDCLISIGAYIATAIVRDVSWSGVAKTVQFQPFGGRATYSHNVGYALSAEVTVVEDAGMQTPLMNGAKLAVTSGSGWSGTFIVSNVTRSEPLDGLVTASCSLELALA